ncbi:o-succinylbenzoate--CoA ligase [Actinomadura sp. NBRC 104412]|uniref:AMP-binding protein n=1 Tax=Actinomadura sp. NBRC 104412 TaxID=3032203 RepID=UPI0024A13F87|nr:AMP-binding protein [Actinomadura sp. NBRC 104412]GLZ09088.1 o-succinylbenzoate--CoA ligase [Actinomadura sp. NBRC 104412]
MQVIEFFDRGAALNPGGIAFVRPDGTGALTYAEAADLTHRVASALIENGLSPGAPVGVLSANTTRLFPCVLGVLRAGCAWVALNARSTPDDLIALLDLVGARALLHSADLADVAERIRGAVGTLEQVVAIDDLEKWAAPAGVRVPPPPLDPEAVAGYFGTGGTTGRPKAVEVPNRAFETMIHAFNAHMPERDPVNLVAAPMTHAAGALVFPVLALGGRNIVHDGVVPEEIVESIERNAVTRLFLPPTAIYALLDHSGTRRRDLSSLRYFIYGAAPMSVAKLEEAMDVFGPVMAQCYGQTELPMMCTYFGPDEHAEARARSRLRARLASCGRPSLVANVAVVDDDGAPRPVGEPGEIVVRSSLRMKGYHKAPDQTAAVSLPGGWLATGDVGRFDEDGYLYIVDRKRDLIISGGFNVFPSEVEQVLLGHPAVRDCAVIGLPDRKWGERVTAVVQLKAGATADPDDLIALCKSRLGSIKAPKEVIFRELPKSPVGKVLKRALRDDYWRGRDRMV